MDSHPRLCRTLPVIFSIVALLIATTDVQPAYSAQSLNAFAHEVISILAGNNFARVGGYVSSDGILVVNRYVDWSPTGEAAIQTNLNSAGFGLSIPPPADLTWIEQEDRYDRYDINGLSFKSILKQFHELIDNSEDGYRGTIVASANTRDDWGSRYLGPSVQGKIASNTFWYIYFVREGDSWKIWRLELTVH
jgi:hypothetical protein